MSILGGNIPGFIPKHLINGVFDNNDSIYRSELRRAVNTKIGAVTPFRTFTNSGDILGRVNYSCGGSSEVPQSKPQIHGIKSRGGHVLKSCDGTGIPGTACNPKFVFDSSDFIKYKRQKAMLKNYNNLSNGGTTHSNQSTLKLLRI